jgi:putative transposase
MVDRRNYDDDRAHRKQAEEKLDYMHLNPMRCGLVTRAVDWKWRSAR